MANGVLGDQKLLECFLIALLSVGGWSSDIVWPLRQALRQEGLLDPRSLASFDEDKISKRLLAAGHKRGPFMTELLATRLHGAAERIVAIGVERVLSVLRTGTAEEVGSLHLPGVGPTVIGNFLALRKV